ncbi:RNA-binding protein [Marchantia polymorpha subsp. ruderalis]
MELCGTQFFSCRQTSVFPIAARCTALHSVGRVCLVVPRISLTFNHVSVLFRRVRPVSVPVVQFVRSNGSFAAARAVPVAEDVESAEQKERVGKKGFQLLGNKEKKELRAFAHSLGKDINVQQVGKLGITPTVITSISDALEANEIIKVKVLENCSSEQDEIIALLEDSTGAQTVGKIGRTLLLYRASLKKLAATEKKAEKPKRRSRIAMSAGRSTVKSRRSAQ